MDVIRDEILQAISPAFKQALVTMLLLNIIVSGISILFTETIKSSYEHVFVKKECPVIFKWLINFFVVIGLSTMSVILFNGQASLSLTIIFIGIISIFSWAISTLGYAFVIKGIFDGCKVLLNKIKDQLIDSEKELVKSKLELEQTKNLLRKEIIISELSNKG